MLVQVTVGAKKIEQCSLSNFNNSRRRSFTFWTHADCHIFYSSTNLNVDSEDSAFNRATVERKFSISMHLLITMLNSDFLRGQEKKDSSIRWYLGWMFLYFTAAADGKCAQKENDYIGILQDFSNYVTVKMLESDCFLNHKRHVQIQDREFYCRWARLKQHSHDSETMMGGVM